MDNTLPENLNINVESQNNEEKSIDAVPSVEAIEVSPVESQPSSLPVEQGPSSIPVTPIIEPQNDQNQTIPAQTNEPLIIEDEIAGGGSLEKPWIEKAERIIEDNEDDPYKEEEEHEDLQIDYLEKRFGKKLKRSTEEE